MEPKATSFAWRRELPLICLPMIAALVIRLIAAHYPWLWFGSDTAIFGLAIQDIAAGKRFPLMVYGQDYLGTLEMYLATPWSLLYPGSHLAFATSSSLLFTLTIPVYYRLFFELGGRIGALTATLTIAIGTTWLILQTGGQLMGYTSVLVLGSLLLLFGPRFLRLPTGRRSFGLGLILGLGYWCNPQIMIFAGPLAVALWARGRCCEAISDGRLREELGRAFWPTIGLFGLILGLLLFSSWLCFHGPIHTSIGSIDISLGKPRKYFTRFIKLLACALVVLEFFLAVDRKAWIKLGGMAALGALLGVTPLLIAKATHTGKYVLKAPTALDPSVASKKLPQLGYHCGMMMLDDPGVPGATPALRRTLSTTRWCLLALAALGVLAACAAQRGELLRLVTLRQVVLTPLSLHGLTAAALSALYTIHVGHPQVRYFLYLWIPTGGLIAWATARLATRTYWLAGPLILIVLGYYGAGTGVLLATHLPSRPDLDPVVLASIEQRGLRYGFGNYWSAYRFTLRSNEQIVVAVFPRELIGGQDPGLDRTPWYTAQVKNRLQFAIFNHEPPSLPTEKQAEAAFRTMFGDRIVEFWTVGPYRLYRLRR